jgi:hypothetical protein
MAFKGAPHILHHPAPAPSSLIYVLKGRDMFALVEQASDTLRTVRKAGR